MNAGEFKKRTRLFAIRTMQFVRASPRAETTTLIGRQLLRAGTSVGSNYRAACRARSRADFIGKMKIVEEECDESIYWMELLIEDGYKSATTSDLLKEANEILSLVVASIKTARDKL